MLREKVGRIGEHYPHLVSFPGVLITGILWLVTWVRLDYSSLVEENYGLMQFLAREVLATDAISGLLNLHMQPPLLNFIAALDLWLTPQSHAFFALSFLAMTVGALILTVETLRLLGSPQWLQVSSGVLFGLLPATVVYSLWSYNTTPTLFGASVAIWGVARMVTKPIIGSTSSAVGVLILVLTRSAFVWVFAVVWVGALGLRVYRQSLSGNSSLFRFAPLAVILLLLLTAQFHYFSRFGLVTMSSWSGENLAKALIQSGELTLPSHTEGEWETCQRSLLRSLRDESPPLWDPVAFRSLAGCSEIPAYPDRGTEAWDSPAKDGNYGFLGNLNWSEELVAAKEWQRLMTRVVLSNPSQLFRMAFTSESGPRESGVGIYLGPAEDYSEVTVIRQHHPLADLGGLLSMLFAPTAIVFGLVALAGKRGWNNPAMKSTLWFVAALVFYHAAVSNLAEYGEGMRFQAEITGPLIVLLAVGWGALRRAPELETS